MLGFGTAMELIKPFDQGRVLSGDGERVVRNVFDSDIENGASCAWAEAGSNLVIIAAEIIEE